jgi:hypothetical protein
MIRVPKRAAARLSLTREAVRELDREIRAVLIELVEKSDAGPAMQDNTQRSVNLLSCHIVRSGCATGQAAGLVQDRKGGAAVSKTVLKE